MRTPRRNDVNHEWTVVQGARKKKEEERGNKSGLYRVVSKSKRGGGRNGKSKSAERVRTGQHKTTTGGTARGCGITAGDRERKKESNVPVQLDDGATL